MISVRQIGWRLAAVVAAVSAGCGLAVASAGLAQAAVPNAWGFALVKSPSGPVVAGHWAESVPSATPVAIPGGPGEVTVRFQGIGFFKGGVVHATAVIDTPAWCQAERWRPLGGAEFVTVRCFRTGGIPSFVPFTVMFSASSGTLPGGLAYAYVHYTGTAVASSFNSKGLPNTVTALPLDTWRVRLPGPGPVTASGGIQVTAVNTTPTICDIASQAWTPAVQVVIVRCYNAGGAPKPSGWTLSYQRARAINGAKPSHFAYTVNNMPLSPSYVPAPPAVNFNSVGGINTITRAGGGLWLVRFPRVGSLPNTVLVSAFAPVARICNLNTVWGTFGGDVVVRDVACYQPSGLMAPTKSFITDTSK